MLHPVSLRHHGPMRSLEQYLDELVERFDALRLDDPRRCELARRIRAVEEQIGEQT